MHVVIEDGTIETIMLKVKTDKGSITLETRPSFPKISISRVRKCLFEPLLDPRFLKITCLFHQKCSELYERFHPNIPTNFSNR